MTDRSPYDLVVRGGTVVTPDGLLSSGVLAIRAGRIAAVGTEPLDATIKDPAQEIDAAGCLVMPGLVDVHVHGAGGEDVGKGDLTGISQTLAAHGVTAFLPTLIPEPAQQLRDSVARLAGAMRDRLPGAQPLGLHLEGPFLSPAQPGCLDAACFQLPNPTELASLCTAAGGTLRRMTIAVELPGALALLPALTAAGVSPSLGHTAATFSEVVAASALGLRQATHSFNAMRGFHHREPGAAGAVLLCDEIVAEVIADGHHVRAEAFELLYRVKGASRIALASDAAAPAGLPNGVYQWAGRDLVCADGVCHTQSGQLAGSATLLDGALRFLATSTAIPLRDIITMASTTPATAAGRGDRKGRLAVGYDADIAIFAGDWHCRATIVRGNLVYRQLP